MTFQLTSSHGGWRQVMLSNLVHHLFNSHPHKEDDKDASYRGEEIKFSTHILTRRMTKPSTVNVRNIIFSTHILTRRMTQRRDHYVYGRCIFNSHPHKEDDEVIWATSCDIAFSTHILTRRMTCRQFADNRYRVFQLTSSQGGWRCGGIDHGEINTFFNSHPHKEDDSSSYCL